MKVETYRKWRNRIAGWPNFLWLTGGAWVLMLVVPVDSALAIGIEYIPMLMLLGMTVISGFAWLTVDYSDPEQRFLRPPERLIGRQWILYAAALSGFTGLFALLYLGLSRSYPDFFGRKLPKIDALYLAIGNLTTVGADGVSPKSVQAKALVMLQMLVDLAWIGFIGAHVVNRLSSKD